MRDAKPSSFKQSYGFSLRRGRHAGARRGGADWSPGAFVIRFNLQVRSEASLARGVVGLLAVAAPSPAHREKRRRSKPKKTSISYYFDVSSRLSRVRSRERAIRRLLVRSSPGTHAKPQTSTSVSRCGSPRVVAAATRLRPGFREQMLRRTGEGGAPVAGKLTVVKLKLRRLAGIQVKDATGAGSRSSSIPPDIRSWPAARMSR